MKYRGEYEIKDLRRDLSDGLGWAHSTESVAKYLETIIPSVREAHIRGYRHTSSTDKNDLKKSCDYVIFQLQGQDRHMSCPRRRNVEPSFHALGKKELEKAETLPTSSGEHQLEVAVRCVDRSGCIYHYGEMINKPQACRAHLALNNDDVHRIHQLSNASEEEYSALSTTSSTKESVQSMTNRDTKPTSGYLLEGVPADHSWRKHQNTPCYRSSDHLSTEQEQIASELAKQGITRREERTIFQTLKSMPWVEQERILKRSRAILAERKTRIIAS